MWTSHPLRALLELVREKGHGDFRYWHELLRSSAAGRDSGWVLSFEKFLFEVVFREQAFRHVVFAGEKIAGFGAGPKGSRIIDFIWQGILIESKLTQAAFKLSQFKVFLGAAKNAGTELWYIFLKAPSKEFADELAALGRAEGVRVRIFSFNP